MSKPKGSKQNVGKRNAYQCHVMQNTGKIPPNIFVDAWFPETAQNQELAILRKIYELCGHKDSRPVYIGSYDQLSRLYLTSEYIQNDDGLFVPDEYEHRRLSERYDDFERRHLVLAGGVGNVGLTFSGLRHMEALMASEPKTDILQTLSDISKDVLNLSATQEQTAQAIENLSNKFSDFIVQTDKNQKFNIADGVSVTGDVCSIISTIPGVLSWAKPVIDKIPGALKVIMTILAKRYSI